MIGTVSKKLLLFIVKYYSGGNVCLEDNWFILFLVTVDTSDSLYIVLLITDSNGGCVIFTAIS